MYVIGKSTIGSVTFCGTTTFLLSYTLHQCKAYLKLGCTNSFPLGKAGLHLFIESVFIFTVYFTSKKALVYFLYHLCMF